jgi:quercetin dioxygenase-like cupin family protein
MPETISVGGIELRFLQSSETGARSLDLFEMTLQPNARMPIAHHHTHWDETIYGLSGVSTWRVDGEDIPLPSGATVFIRRGTIHAFRNDTQAPATCLCILTPGALGPGYFREMAALMAAGAPDPARMKETMLKYGLVPAPG